MVVKAFRDKRYPLGGRDLEWCIYHGLKWRLSLTKVLIIQSEEELPAITSQKITMRTPASPASPDVVCRSLSAAAPFIQSEQAPRFRIHSPSLPPF